MGEETTKVLLELERLRGDVTAGFARLDGKLNTFDQRAKTVEDDVDELKKDFQSMEKDVGSLKARMLAFSTLAAVIGGGGAAGLIQIVGQ